MGLIYICLKYIFNINVYISVLIQTFPRMSLVILAHFNILAFCLYFPFVYISFYFVVDIMQLICNILYLDQVMFLTFLLLSFCPFFKVISHIYIYIYKTN